MTDLGPLVTCETCGGTGWVAALVDHRHHYPYSPTYRCWDCHGTGKHPEGTSWAEIKKADKEAT